MTMAPGESPGAIALEYEQFDYVVVQLEPVAVLMRSAIGVVTRACAVTWA